MGRGCLSPISRPEPGLSRPGIRPDAVYSYPAREAERRRKPLLLGLAWTHWDHDMDVRGAVPHYVRPAVVRIIGDPFEHLFIRHNDHQMWSFLHPHLARIVLCVPSLAFCALLTTFQQQRRSPISRGAFSDVQIDRVRSMATVWLAYRGRLCGRISRNARSDGLKTLVFCNQQGTLRPPMALSGH